MSFMLTEQQFLDGTKTVTRRLGWRFLRAGDRFLAVRKARGLKKGQKQKVLGECEVVSVRLERLDAITLDDVAREGFFGWTTRVFIEMFCREMRPCKPYWIVTRIEFRRIHDNA